MKSESRGILSSVVLTALVCLIPVTAVAGPKNGFSVNAGLANHSMSPQGFSSESSSGLSLGLDYQFSLSDNLSINPFLMSSSESTSTAGVTVGHGIAGLQVRYWLGDMFVGGHLGSYSNVYRDTTTNTTFNSGSGGGLGLAAGWESPDGGLYVMGQVDSATIKYSNTDMKLSGFRLSVGYRWK